MAAPSTSNSTSKASIQTKLHDNIVELGSLTRKLVESFSSSGVGKAPDMKEILKTITTRDEEIQQLAATAVDMCSCQREMASVEEELEQRSKEVAQLQKNLQEAERIIELAVYKGHQKLDAIEQAEKGAVSPEDLIRYAHHISQASSVISPVGWQISDPRRPFPQDIEMRCGFLGQLTSGNKPLPPQLSDGGGGEMLPPPEKKFAMAGVNQNLNNSESGASQLLDMTGSEEPVVPQAQPLPTAS